MDTKGKYESRFQKLSLSCDAFTTGYLVMCLLLLAPYSAVNGGTLVMWFLPLACLLPFALLPLFCALIHRVDSLLFGRYHLAMPLSAFVAAPFFVLAWSARGSGAAQSCAVFFGMLVFATSIMIYRYCAFSVRVRLTGEGIVNSSWQGAAFCAAGAVATLGVFAGFLHYDAATAFLNTAYVLGGACLILAITQYLATYYGIPRLGGKRVQSIGSVFRSFYSGLDTRTYFSALLFEAAYAIGAALIVFFGFAAGGSASDIVAVAAVMIGVYAVSAVVCACKLKRRSVLISVVNLVSVVCACAVLVILSALNTSGDGLLAGLIIAAAAIGFGGAVTVRQTKLRMLTIKPLVTGGIVYILLELTMIAAAALCFIATALVATVGESTHSLTAFIYGFAIAVVAAVAAFVLARRKLVKPAASELAHTAEQENLQ